MLLSSVVALRAMPGLAAYGMTKAAIAGLAVQLAGELGPAGITVNAVAPGATVTERTLQEHPRYADDWGAVAADRAGVVSRRRRRARTLPAQPERVAADGSDVGRGRGLERPLARSSWVLTGPAYQRQTTRAASATTAPTTASRM